MKILFIIPYIAAVYGGPAQVVQDLADSLGKLGITVDVITSNACGSEKLNVPLNTWIEQGNYRIRYFDSWHRNDLVLSPSLLIWLMKNVGTYDGVHTHNRFAPLILLSEWICALRHVPYITTPHGMLEPWALAYKSTKKRLYYLLLERPILRRASLLHGLNPMETKHIRALGYATTATIPNGIHPQPFLTLPSIEHFHDRFPETRDRQIVLFLGRLDPKKGLDLLAPAFAQVHRQFPKTHLVIAGPDNINFLPTVRQYFAQVDCLDAVTFTGMLTGEVKYAALAAASIYIAPSYSEGFSISILEGMAAGLPCIITTQCNFPEAATAEAAYVVKPQAAAISQALMECFTTPRQAEAVGDKARCLILQFYTWHKIATQFQQVYEQVFAR
jgi:glycosyltransferase involved in cell wall biosynthesis